MVVQVVQALVQLDSCIICLDHLEALQLCLPTQQETSTLLSYSGDPSQLSPVER